MSIIACVYGTDYIVLGADRGLWSRSDDGSFRASSVLPSSKLFVHPDAPCVVTATGNTYPDLMADHLECRYTTVGNLAVGLWASIRSAHHPPQVSTDESNENRTILTQTSVLVAGMDDGIPYVYSACYGRGDTVPVRMNLGMKDGVQYLGCGILFDGSFGGLQGLADDDYGVQWANLKKHDAIAFCKFALEMADRAQSFRESTGKGRLVLGPFDFLEITSEGVRQC